GVELVEDTMVESECIVEIRAGAGDHGGKVVDNGPAQQIMDNTDSLTGDYLTGRQFIPVPSERRKKSKKAVKVVGAEENNLKAVTTNFPIGLFTVVTGVSG